jgi:hypothetical protein
MFFFNFIKYFLKSTANISLIDFFIDKIPLIKKKVLELNV